MWDILTVGGIGLILLLDNSRTDPFKDLKFFLNSFDQFIEETSVAIGITQMDISTRPTVDEYQRHLQTIGLKVPVFEVDAREKKDVSTLVQALMFSLDPGLDEE